MLAVTWPSCAMTQQAQGGADFLHDWLASGSATNVITCVVTQADFEGARLARGVPTLQALQPQLARGGAGVGGAS